MAKLNFFNNKRVLITGNTGFKGSWLSMWLHELGAEVFGYSFDLPSKRNLFEDAKLQNDINHFWGDIRNLDKVSKLINDVKPDIIFHLAAQAIVSESYKNPSDTFSTNVMGTCNILESLKGTQDECILVLITSDKSYDNQEWIWGYKETDILGGKDPYSGSKGAAELVIRSYFESFFIDSPIKLGVGRAGNVIGGGDWAKDRIIPDAFRAWENKEAVSIRSPKSTRPWQLVLEPLSGYLNLAMALSEDRSISGEAFNFGPSSDQDVNVETLINHIHGSLEEDYHDFVPISLDEKEFVPESRLLKLNCEKASNILNWKSTLDFKQLTEFVSQWYETALKNPSSSRDISLEQIKEYSNIARSKKIEWSQ